MREVLKRNGTAKRDTFCTVDRGCKPGDISQNLAVKKV